VDVCRERASNAARLELELELGRAGKLRRRRCNARVRSAWEAILKDDGVWREIQRSAALGGSGVNIIVRISGFVRTPWWLFPGVNGNAMA
jgi:hypothetical protein